MDSQKTLSFNCERKFGVETEICDFSHRDFKKHPLERGELPDGIDHIACLLGETLKTQIQTNKWHYTHNNEAWVLKPDSSCGIEICSPVFRGWHGLEKTCLATYALSQDKRVSVDDRCGLHVHADVSDCTPEQIASILAYWIKCESVFLDCVPPNRKKNRYCQQIGLSPLFDIESPINHQSIVKKLGDVKYFTVNSYHMNRGNRQTLEWRIIEGKGCLDPYLVKNWVRLVVHFVDQAKARGLPKQYIAGDPWSSLCWLDPMDVMDFLGFFGPISKGLEETRNWFLARLASYLPNPCVGIFSPEARSVSKKQIDEIIARLGIGGNIATILNPPDMKAVLFNSETRV